MAPALSTITALGVLWCVVAQAQQQAPTQHAPAMKTYAEPTESEKTDKRRADEATASKVTLYWYPIPQATRYVVSVSRQPDMSGVFFKAESRSTAYVTPEFPPGAYYYQVEGYEGDRALGKTGTLNFVIGKPLAITGRYDRLPAPSIIGPKHLDLFPTYGHVRLAWEGVDGARGYRFRLWDEDKVRENQRWKRDTPPRWITEVGQPWIEVHDAPYTSYMFLESGLYRWDVAAVDSDGGQLGNVSMGYFRVSRQWFFKPSEVLIRAGYGVAPHASYSVNSSYVGTSFELSSVSHRFDSDLDWWFLRQWGVNVGGGFRTFHIRAPRPDGVPFDDISFFHVNLDALFRTYLSHVPWGWWFVFSAGAAFEEVPHVDQIGNAPGSIHVSRPIAMGAKLGFRVHKRWQSPWELQTLGNAFLAAFTLNDPTTDSFTQTALNADLTLRLAHHWTNHFATALGFTGEFKRFLHTPEPFLQSSSVTWPNWYAMLTFQFNYYPPPDETSYYPGHRDSAYYPRGDSSSSQRWRPR